MMKKTTAQGFTLLEILLVLVLLSLVAVAVVATLPGNKTDHAKQDATRLYQRLQLLNEEAVLSGRDFGLRIGKNNTSYHKVKQVFCHQPN